MEVVALDDSLIQPYSVHNVAMHAAFEGREDWIVEKVIIGMDDQNIMAAPTAQKCCSLWHRQAIGTN